MNTDRAGCLLLAIKEALDAFGLPFFLTLGTCLEAVREGRFIEGDGDIDLGFLIEDLKDGAQLASRLAATGFQVLRISKPIATPRAYKIRAAGVKADLAGYFKNKGERYCPSSSKDYSLVYPADLLERTESIEFIGAQFFVPSPVEDYLRAQYGPHWKKPNPDWSPPSSPARVIGYMRAGAKRKRK